MKKSRRVKGGHKAKARFIQKRTQTRKEKVTTKNNSSSNRKTNNKNTTLAPNQKPSAKKLSIGRTEPTLTHKTERNTKKTVNKQKQKIAKLKIETELKSESPNAQMIKQSLKQIFSRGTKQRFKKRLTQMGILKRGD